MKKRPKRSVKREPLWKGPGVDGISFSLLSKFLVCRERFRLQVVEGLKECEPFNHPLEFGSCWHEAEEVVARDGPKGPWLKAVGKYCQKLQQKHPNATVGIGRTYHLVKLAFPLYLSRWSKVRAKKQEPILQEQSFRVPYELPSKRIVILRGKWDSVFRTREGYWLQENKTKGKIDEAGVQATLHQNLQAMLYLIALQTCMDAKHKPFHRPWKRTTEGRRPIREKKAVIKGVLYNVIRRPLGDQHAIKQRKSETETQFYRRVADQIKADPTHYFFRWECRIHPPDIEKFKTHVFDPILEQLCDWWEWIAVDPWNPWSITESYRQPLIDCGYGSPHYQSPWGVYNSLGSGFRGDYFDYLTTGRTAGLKTISELFPELKR